MFEEVLFISNSPNEVNIYDYYNINSPNTGKKNYDFRFGTLLGTNEYISISAALNLFCMFGHGSYGSSLLAALVVTFSFCQRFSPHLKITTNLFQKNLIGSAFYIIYSSLQIPLNSIRAGLSQLRQSQF